MKRFIIFIILLSVMLSCFGCKKKAENDSGVPSDSDTVAQKEGDTVYPFADISADDIKEVFFGFQEHYPEYSCEKTYTDTDTVVEIIEFLKKAPMTEDRFETQNVGYNPRYIIELRDSSGEWRYKISFFDKDQPGYPCYFYINNGNEKNKDHHGNPYIDSDYLYDLILHIATLDGREPEWIYDRPFIDIHNADIGALGFIASDGKEDLYTVDSDKIGASNQDGKYITVPDVYFSALLVRHPDDKSMSVNDVDIAYTVVFYDKNGEKLVEYATDGILVDDNKYKLVFRDFRDKAQGQETLYFARKTQFLNYFSFFNS